MQHDSFALNLHMTLDRTSDEPTYWYSWSKCKVLCFMAKQKVNV